MSLVDKIVQLKKQKKAVILAHNYQRNEVQDIADYVGDSIELSRKAMEEREARIIVFSAVDFMAESAAILNPEKKVLLPTLSARCPMAQMLTVEEIKRSRARYPTAPLVLYVNSLAAAKAYCDICCTSANAVDVVKSLEDDTVLFGPDRNLAEYVQRKTGKTVIPIPEWGFVRRICSFNPKKSRYSSPNTQRPESWCIPNARSKCRVLQTLLAALRRCVDTQENVMQKPLLWEPNREYSIASKRRTLGKSFSWPTRKLFAPQ